MRRVALESLIVLSLLLGAFPTAAQKHGKTHKPSAPIVDKDDEFYVCPMHPDVTSDRPGNCPKCNMTMGRTNRPEAADYQMRITTIPTVIKAGEKFRLTFNITHPRSGLPVKEFNIFHDMPFHLFVVSEDLSYFSHIHPQQDANGSFTIETIVPKPGPYIIYSDIFPVGGLPQVIHRSLITAGFKGDLFSSRAELEPDKSLTKTLGGVRFALTLNPADPVGGKTVTLNYHLTDEKTGDLVKDLQPYLGAWGHTLILSEDARDYVHSHPTEVIADNVDRTKICGGADVSFQAFLPRAGRYRIWSQFQRKGQLITVEFTIGVRGL